MTCLCPSGQRERWSRSCAASGMQLAPWEELGLRGAVPHPATPGNGEGDLLLVWKGTAMWADSPPRKELQLLSDGLSVLPVCPTWQKLPFVQFKSPSQAQVAVHCAPPSCSSPGSSALLQSELCSQIPDLESWGTKIHPYSSCSSNN